VITLPNTLPTHATALEVIAALLRPNPIELEGSLAEGRGDAWSDLDLCLRVPAPEVLRYAQQLLERMRELPQHVASFRCDHLAMPNLVVAVLEIERSLVKVDVKVVAMDRVPVAGAPGPADGYWASADLLDRGLGWAFYTHAKIERGELLEAADVLHQIMMRVVLPLWQEYAGLPRTGARHVEERLTKEQLSLMWKLRPQHPGVYELRRCLRGVLDEIESAWLRLRDERAPGLVRLRTAVMGVQG